MCNSVKFIHSSEIKILHDPTPEGYFLIETNAGKWFFSYSLLKWHGPYDDKFEARKAMLIGHVNPEKPVYYVIAHNL